MVNDKDREDVLVMPVVNKGTRRGVVVQNSRRVAVLCSVYVVHGSPDVSRTIVTAFVLKQPFPRGM